MSDTDLITVTVVYPRTGAETVRYPHCEIDEVDSDGRLRIAAVETEEDVRGFEYVVWEPGTFTRAETLREPAFAEGDDTPVR